MEKPRVFISSTFYDLKHVKISLQKFTDRLGYEALLSDKAEIASNSELTVDESYYREVSNCDMFVLILGGKYSAVADEKMLKNKDEFFERYESMTKNEFETALARNIPIYIMMDKSVGFEFETFKRNRDNENIQYAHVDSVKIFRLIDDLLSKSENYPIKQFEQLSEIEEWLQGEWAKLFRKLINGRSEQNQLVSLSEKIDELYVINSSLQRYMEAVVSKVSNTPDEAKKVIKKEQETFEAEKKDQKIYSTPFVRKLNMLYDLSREDVKMCFSNAVSLEDLSRKIASKTRSKILDWHTSDMIKVWRGNASSVDDLNEIRALLNKEPLAFEKTTVNRQVAEPATA